MNINSSCTKISITHTRHIHDFLINSGNGTKPHKSSGACEFNVITVYLTQTQCSNVMCMVDN